MSKTKQPRSEDSGTRQILQTLDGTGWWEATLTEETITPQGITVNLCSNRRCECGEQSVDNTNHFGELALPDYAVDTDSHTLSLRGLDNSHFPTQQKTQFSEFASLRTPVVTRNERITARKARITPNYVVLLAFSFQDQALPKGGELNVWVERNYQTDVDTIVDWTDGVYLVKHDEPVQYDWSTGKDSYGDYEGRVNLLGETPYVALFQDYENATALYGLLDELDDIPKTLGLYNQNRHIIGTGRFGDNGIPRSVARLGMAGITTYVKTTTGPGEYPDSSVAEDLGLSARTVRDHLETMRYEP